MNITYFIHLYLWDYVSFYNSRFTIVRSSVSTSADRSGGMEQTATGGIGAAAS